jgi:hypothetical protein
MNINPLPLATRILYPLETNVSTGMFLRDTGGCLLSKLAVSRSKDETREISFAELSESAIFYFSVPLLAGVLSKQMGAFLKQSPGLIGKNIKELSHLDQSTLESIKSAKLAKIGIAFSLLLPAIYAIAPLRNILTLSVTGKEEFLNVIGLKNKHKARRKEHAKEKAISFIKLMGLYALGGLGLTFSLIAAQKIKATKQLIQPINNFLLKHLDFEGQAGLSLKQLGFLIMPVSIKSYFDASRDRYEVFENARRFLITIPMMFFGQDFVEKKIYKFFDRRFGSQLSQGNKITSFDDILKMPKNLQAKNLKAKNWSIALAFLINTMGIAFAVGVLNRLSTKRNYQDETFARLDKKANDVSIWLGTLQRNNGLSGNKNLNGFRPTRLVPYKCEGYCKN